MNTGLLRRGSPEFGAECRLLRITMIVRDRSNLKATIYHDEYTQAAESL